MPIHDVGYRTWKGDLTSTWSRWWVISQAGIVSAFKSRWIRRLLLASWIPVIYLGTAFFVFEKLMEAPTEDLIATPFTKELLEDPRLEDDPIANQIREQLAGEIDEEALAQQLRKVQLQHTARQLPMLPGSESLADAIESGEPSQLRNRVWCWLLMSFLRYPQGIMTLLIIGLMVPPLIARDVRSRAFLLYYSRPLNRMEYLIGKLAIPAGLLALITLVPAFALYFFGVMLSPNLFVLMDTWDIPFRIVLATAVCIIPTCLVALLFSSMTQESRFAGFAWFTVWGLGAVVWTVIYYSNVAQKTVSGVDPRDVDYQSNWSLVSIYSTIGRVQSWIFGLEMNFSQALPSIIMLLVISLISFAWLYRRISAPVRI